MTPDMSAETWLGAAGGARGSQTWSGTTPALVAKPPSARKNRVVRVVSSRRPAPRPPPPRLSRVGGVGPEVGRTVEGRRDGDEGDHEQEVGRQPVHGEREPREREEGRERLG